MKDEAKTKEQLISGLDELRRRNSELEASKIVHKRGAGEAMHSDRVWLAVAGMFALLAILVLLDEVLDLPHLLLGAPHTPVNWRESILEIAMVAIIGFFSVRKLIHDTTRRKRSEQALEESSANIKLFAYSVAHDLKSPAVGIYGITKLLNRNYGDALDEKGRNYCDQIVRSAEHIAELVENINIYITAKESPLKIEPISIKEILQMVRDEFSAQLSIRQIEWLEPETVARIKADRLSILRVFRNFVDNALKYGGDDLSEIRIDYETTPDLHIFSVADNGVGIKGENYENIFKLFKREEYSRGIAGTGLGLAIVREILESHRGRVWVEPRREKGTIFYISISKDL